MQKDVNGYATGQGGGEMITQNIKRSLPSIAASLCVVVLLAFQAWGAEQGHMHNGEGNVGGKNSSSPRFWALRIQTPLFQTTTP